MWKGNNVTIHVEMQSAHFILQPDVSRESVENAALRFSDLTDGK